YLPIGKAYPADTSASICHALYRHLFPKSLVRNTFSYGDSSQNKTILVSDVLICLARETVSVNAPQLGTAINGPAGNLPLADFLFASSPNDAVASDFKTIAAHLFAGPTTTAISGQTDP